MAVSGTLGNIRLALSNAKLVDRMDKETNKPISRMIRLDITFRFQSEGLDLGILLRGGLFVLKTDGSYMYSPSGTSLGPFKVFRNTVLTADLQKLVHEGIQEKYADLVKCMFSNDKPKPMKKFPEFDEFEAQEV